MQVWCDTQPNAPFQQTPLSCTTILQGHRAASGQPHSARLQSGQAKLGQGQTVRRHVLCHGHQHPQATGQYEGKPTAATQLNQALVGRLLVTRISEDAAEYSAIYCSQQPQPDVLQHATGSQLRQWCHQTHLCVPRATHGSLLTVPVPLLQTPLPQLSSSHSNRYHSASQQLSHALLVGCPPCLLANDAMDSHRCRGSVRYCRRDSSAAESAHADEPGSPPFVSFRTFVGLIGHWMSACECTSTPFVSAILRYTRD